MWLWSRRNPLDRSRMRGGGSLMGHMSGDNVFIHPDVWKLIPKEQRQWATHMRKLKASGVPTAGLGFSAPFLPNTEPVVAPGAVALSAATETNLYTPATSTNAAWSLIPQGAIRAPQSWRIYASGTVQTSTSALTGIFTSRIGTSATPASNASLGATGAMVLPTTLTTIWWYEGHATVRAVGSGTTATAVGAAQTCYGNAAAGSITSSTTGLAGITTAVGFDSTIQQGYVISVTASAITVTVQLQQFTLIAWD